MERYVWRRHMWTHTTQSCICDKIWNQDKRRVWKGTYEDDICELTTLSPVSVTRYESRIKDEYGKVRIKTTYVNSQHSVQYLWPIISIRHHMFWYYFVIALCVSEDVDIAICGKQEENCVNLARSEWKTINLQIIQQHINSSRIALLIKLLSVMGQLFVLERQYGMTKTKITPAQQLPHNFMLNIPLCYIEL
jgi:hypothetical protein